MEGSGHGSSESEITGIAKAASPASTCSSGLQSTAAAVGDGGSASAAADVWNEREGAAVVSEAGCDQRAAEAPVPEMDPRNGARKSEKLAPVHADAAVVPLASTSFKRSGGSSRRTVQKRVMTVPIADIAEGSRPRSGGASSGAAGDAGPPPSDSWTWRKYGQKPIKGSPYPRGYYRCSSSKGCPARKQVERNRADPTMLIVTYAAEHNHPWPMPRSNSHHASRAQAAVGRGGAGPPPPANAGKPPPSSSSTDEEDMEVEYENAAPEEEGVEVEVKEKILAEPEFVTAVTASTTVAMATTTSTTNAPATASSPTSEGTETFSADNSLSGAATSDDSTTLIPTLAPEGVDDLCSSWFPSDTEISLCSTADTATMMLPFSYNELLADLGGRSGGGYGMNEDEDEDSLFAGLGELPEFSLVFRRGMQLPEHAADFTR